MKKRALNSWKILLSSRWPGVLTALGLLLSGSSLHAQSTVTTIGGGNVNPPYWGFANGSTLHASLFNMPSGMAIDSSGTLLYIADYTNNAVRLVSAAGNTATSVTTTWATNGVSRPVSVVLDGAGNVYVLNRGNGNNGAVLHFTGAGGTAVAQASLATSLVNATSMARDGANNLYVTVNGNKVIRITPDGVSTNIGTVSLAGTSLQGITMLSSGYLALTDAGNNGIVIMDPITGSTTNLTGFHGVGDTLGASSVAKFRAPQTLAEAGGGILVVADRGNNKVKLVSPTGTVSLLYGVSSNLWVTGAGKYPGWADGAGTASAGSAESRQPYGVVVAPDGSVFVDEVYYHALRHVTGTGLTAPPAPGTPGSGGSGGGPGQPFSGPAGIAYDSIDNFLYVANTTNNSVQILDLNVTTNATRTFLNSLDGLNNPVSVLLDSADNIYVLNQGPSTNGYVLAFDFFGNAYGPIITGLNKPTAFALDGIGNLLITEQSGKIIAFGASVSNVVATITNVNVSLQGIALFDDGTLAVSDAGNHVIWSVNPITKLILKLTGQLGTNGVSVGASNFAKLNKPRQLVRVGGNQIVGADSGNNRLVLITRSGTVTTNRFNSVTGATVWFGNNSIDPVSSGNPKFVAISSPVGVAIDNAGNVFDSETGHSNIRRMIGTTITAPGSTPGVPVPVYSSPAGIVVNGSGTILYVADPTNNTVFALNLVNNQTSVAFDSSSGISHPVDVGFDVSSNLYVLNQGTGGNGSILVFDQFGNPLGTNAMSLAMPTAMTVNFNGDIYVAELNGVIQKFGSGGSNTVAVVATNANVRLQGIAVLDNGAVVVSDSGNHVIWKIVPGNTNPVVFAGILGTTGSNFGSNGVAKLNTPMHLATAAGGKLLIVDSGNNRVVAANDAGTVSSALISTNAQLWFGSPSDPVHPGNPNFLPMVSPVGIAIGASGTVFVSESVYRDIRGILNTGFQPPVIPAPPSAPRIGWFDYELQGGGFFTVLHPVTIATFNNDQLIAIDPVTNGVSTYYISGAPPIISDPGVNNGSTPPFYQDHISFAAPLTLQPTPDIVIKAVNVDSIGQASAVTTAEFIFQVANPTITGFNGAQFTVSDITSNSVFWYTLDGTDPTNAPPSIGPVSLVGTNSATLSLVINSNILFKARAFRAGYFPSGIALQSFSPANFDANTISFGFSSGEASSDFVASPGQTFYAPVTLSILPGTVMYSLQFNLTVTNGGPNPGPLLAPGAFGFQSMLMKPDPATPGLLVPIPPFMFVGNATGPLNPGQIVHYEGTNFVSLLTTDLSLNLLGVGWLERSTGTNLYPATAQDLIALSLAHDDLFEQSGNKIILGGYSFQIPQNSVNGQTYKIQIARPSATSDGIGTPGSDVYIGAPTSGSTGGGAPVNALKYVTVGQRKYLAGSVYPFRWFNAGDFGSSNLVNADVIQVFQSAIYSFNYPPFGSDFFDGMDSCGNFGFLDNNPADPNFGNYTNAAALNNGQLNALFDGNDTTINQVAFGDGFLDVCDVYVTFRRSLDPSLTWFRRFWNNGVLVADTGAPNVASHALVRGHAVAPKDKPANTNTIAPQVNFSAGTVIGSAGQTVQVPINATILGDYPLRVLLLNLSVVPLDGSPALTSVVTFSQAASVLGAPYTTGSDTAGNFSAVWLNATNSGLTGTVTIGTLFIKIPAGASGTAAYAVHFDHASGSPNGLASLPVQKSPGLITTAARTNSTYGDGIPDSWRLQWFGSVNNVLSTSNACPSGDGVPNWKKFIAGVDPNVAGNFPSVNPKAVPFGSTTAIHWPSVLNKKYVIQRATSLYGAPWTVLSTNIGTGGDMEYDDNSTANTKFYRVQILP